ncbi:hypothetical protein JCM17380_50540 [Desulfosporosinus burensis]
MRWLWRLLMLFMFLVLVRTLFVPQPKAFIALPEGQNWGQKIQGEMRQWQKLSQDLPASIEVEMRRLWNDFQPNGEGEEV